MKNIGGLILVLLMAACAEEQKATQKIFNFDGLIDEQVSLLSNRKSSLGKSASVSNQKSDTTFRPSGNEWVTELEVFRQMEAFNRPIYRSEYSINDPLKDTKSNLKIRQYVSKTSPITSLKFYYHDEFAQLKKIEATLLEKNILYSNGHDLIMEFEEEDGKPMLHHYSMSGFQKMIFGDTVRFSLVGQIDR